MALDTALIIGLIIGITVGTVIVYMLMRKRTKTELEKYRAEYELAVQERIKEAQQKSLDRSRTTLKGKIAEQMTPLLPEFTENYEPADARFIGTPIDYIIFKNMSKYSNDNNAPLELVLLEIKTGNSALTKLEKAVKDAVDNQRVKFDTLRIKTELST